MHKMTFISKRVKTQFSDLAVLNLTIYIVLAIYEHMCGVDMHTFTYTKSFVYVDMYIGYKTVTLQIRKLNRVL